MSKPVIALPYFPGSNGDIDAIDRITEAGMVPSLLYCHIGDEKRLEENARVLREEVDGAVMCGGFPYEDRLGFGIVPARIKQYADAMRHLVDSGKPVIAFCSGNQIAHAMGLAFPANSPHKVRLLPNICDRNGKLVYHEFIDSEVYTRLECNPRRTAFTDRFKPGEVMPDIIDHGGGRFWADTETLQYLTGNGMIVTRYCDEKGKVVDEFPVNPNGSMLNIESVTNTRGNLKIGMCHNERKLNALMQGRANLVFESMREYIEEGCPDLSCHAAPQDMQAKLKDYGYLCHGFEPEWTVDIYIKMLTDDNERTAAQLFLGSEGIDRRRLLRVQLDTKATPELARKVVEEIARMDFLDGIMLKKDLPSATITASKAVHTYEVVGKGEGGVLHRDFTEGTEVVEGYPVTHEQVPQPNPDGHKVRKRLWETPFLKQHVAHVNTGMVWFFPDEGSRTRALEELLD